MDSSTSLISEDESMTSRTSISTRLPIAALCAATALGLTVGVAGGIGLAMQAPPAENIGVSLRGMAEIPAPMVERAVGLEGHHLMVRMLTVEPGGRIRKHDHVGRPGLVAMVSGELVDGREGGEITYSAENGAAIAEDEDTVHWLFNRGEEPARAILCDLRAPKPGAVATLEPR
jgi:quercetin dioxygenase-like cupin family protein